MVLKFVVSELAFLSRKRSFVMPIVLLTIFIYIATPINDSAKLRTIGEFMNFIYMTTALFVSVFVGALIADTVRDERVSGVLEYLYVYSSMDGRMYVVARALAGAILSMLTTIALCSLLMLRSSFVSIGMLCLSCVASVGPVALFTVLSFVISPKSIQIVNTAVIPSIILVPSLVARYCHSFEPTFLEYVLFSISLSLLVVALAIYVWLRDRIVELSIVKR